MFKKNRYLLSTVFCSKFSILGSILLYILFLSACAMPSMSNTDSNESGVVETNGDTQQSGNVAAEADYQIGPEDVLEISVWGEETLQRTVLVRPDGGISFPLAGDLRAAGKTPEELRQELTNRIKKYIPEPFVTVSVSEVAGYQIYVLGQVNNPGQYLVGRYVDVLQALTLAGGLTPFASENNITIRRRQNGKEVVLPFSYSAAKQGQDSPQNVILQSGDTVVVP
jgi:polysaccharide export outer membrane protein